LPKRQNYGLSHTSCDFTHISAKNLTISLPTLDINRILYTQTKEYNRKPNKIAIFYIVASDNAIFLALI